MRSYSRRARSPTAELDDAWMSSYSRHVSHTDSPPAVVPRVASPTPLQQGRQPHIPVTGRAPKPMLQPQQQPSSGRERRPDTEDRSGGGTLGAAARATPERTTAAVPTSLSSAATNMRRPRSDGTGASSGPNVATRATPPSSPSAVLGAAKRTVPAGSSSQKYRKQKPPPVSSIVAKKKRRPKKLSTAQQAALGSSDVVTPYNDHPFHQYAAKTPDKSMVTFAPRPSEGLVVFRDEEDNSILSGWSNQNLLQRKKELSKKASRKANRRKKSYPEKTAMSLHSPARRGSGGPAGMVVAAPSHNDAIASSGRSGPGGGGGGGRSGFKLRSFVTGRAGGKRQSVHNNFDNGGQRSSLPTSSSSSAVSPRATAMRKGQQQRDESWNRMASPQLVDEDETEQNANPAWRAVGNRVDDTTLNEAGDFIHGGNAQGDGGGFIPATAMPTIREQMQPEHRSEWGGEQSDAWIQEQRQAGGTNAPVGSNGDDASEYSFPLLSTPRSRAMLLEETSPEAPMGSDTHQENESEGAHRSLELDRTNASHSAINDTHGRHNPDLRHPLSDVGDGQAAASYSMRAAEADARSRSRLRKTAAMSSSARQDTRLQSNTFACDDGYGTDSRRSVDSLGREVSPVGAYTSRTSLRPNDGNSPTREKRYESSQGGDARGRESRIERLKKEKRAIERERAVSKSPERSPWGRDGFARREMPLGNIFDRDADNAFGNDAKKEAAAISHLPDDNISPTSVAALNEHCGEPPLPSSGNHGQNNAIRPKGSLAEHESRDSIQKPTPPNFSTRRGSNLQDDTTERGSDVQVHNTNELYPPSSPNLSDVTDPALWGQNRDANRQKQKLRQRNMLEGNIRGQRVQDRIEIDDEPVVDGYIRDDEFEKSPSRVLFGDTDVEAKISREQQQESHNAGINANEQQRRSGEEHDPRQVRWQKQQGEILRSSQNADSQRTSLDRESYHPHQKHPKNSTSAIKTRMPQHDQGSPADEAGVHHDHGVHQQKWQSSRRIAGKDYVGYNSGGLANHSTERRDGNSILSKPLNRPQSSSNHDHQRQWEDNYHSDKRETVDDAGERHQPNGNRSGGHVTEGPSKYSRGSFHQETGGPEVNPHVQEVEPDYRTSGGRVASEQERRDWQGDEIIDSVKRDVLLRSEPDWRRDHQGLAASAANPANSTVLHPDQGATLEPRHDAVAHYHAETSNTSAALVQTHDEGFFDVVAAIVIQTTVRRYFALMAAQERLYAVHVIQSAVCDWMMRRKKQGFRDAAMQMYDLAATEIQTAFRGWWVRDCLSVDHYCATLIQRSVRCYLCRMAYQYDLYSVIVVQSVVRRNIAMQTSAIRLANIMIIQSIYRGYRARKALRKCYDDPVVAATKIQSQWRSYDAQMNFMHMLADILIMQSIARRWITNRVVVPYMKEQQQSISKRRNLATTGINREQEHKRHVVGGQRKTRESTGRETSELVKMWRDRDAKHSMQQKYRREG